MDAPDGVGVLMGKHRLEATRRYDIQANMIIARFVCEGFIAISLFMMLAQLAFGPL